MPDPNQDGGELKKSQVMLAKTLDQLLELKRQLLQKDPVVVANDEPLGKKRKLNDYDQYLTEGFETMTSWRNETIEDWNDRTRIVGKTGFSAFETSVTRQIEHILADKSRLVKRTKLKRNVKCYRSNSFGSTVAPAAESSGKGQEKGGHEGFQRKKNALRYTCKIGKFHGTNLS